LIRRTGLGLSHGANYSSRPSESQSSQDAIPAFGNAPWQPRFNSEHSATFRHTPQRTFFQPRVPAHKLQALRSTHFKGNKFSTDARPRLPWHHSFAGPSSAIANTMRPLSQTRSTQGPSTQSPLILRRPACTISPAFALSLTACASGPGGSSTTPLLRR